MVVIIEYDINDKPEAHVIGISSAKGCTCGSAIGYPSHGEHFTSVMHMSELELSEIGLTLTDVGR